VLNQLGVGSATTTATLYTDGDGSTLASLYPRDLDRFDRTMDQTETIELVSVDDYCRTRSIDHIDLLKLDIEGNELEALLRAQPDEQQILFRVGVADVVPKSIVYRLIAPTMELSEPIRITCREDKLERLLADLAIQRLDLVISDSPMPTHLDIKGYSQKLGECGISFFATQALADAYGGDFPQCLHGAPLLIPGAETVVRSRLQRWFAEQQIQPKIIGEFDDSALMQAFGQSGSGIFIAPSVIADEVVRQYGVALIGQTVAVTESFYAISVERKVKHPGIVAITEGARRELFTTLP
jgi:LysR family transcriptional activator of nhaA